MLVSWPLSLVHSLCNEADQWQSGHVFFSLTRLKTDNYRTVLRGKEKFLACPSLVCFITLWSSLPLRQLCLTSLTQTRHTLCIVIYCSSSTPACLTTGSARGGPSCDEGDSLTRDYFVVRVISPHTTQEIFIKWYYRLWEEWECMERHKDVIYSRYLFCISGEGRQCAVAGLEVLCTYCMPWIEFHLCY